MTSATQALATPPMAWRQRGVTPAAQVDRSRGGKTQRPLLLGSSLVAALALHGAVFGVVVGSDHPGQGARPTRSVLATTIATRAMQLVPLPREPGDIRRGSETTSAPGQPVTPPSIVDTAPTETTAIAAATTPVTGTATAADGNNGDDSASYLPRRWLTRKPEPQAEVRIDYPPGTPLGEFSAELLLFIDETGHVQRVRSRSATLPPGLEAAARQAFYAVQFRPGEVDGRPVRSLYPVQVNFSVDDGTRNASQP